MKNYTIAAINKVTDEIEHIGTSDLPFKTNPFADMSETHYFDNYEFENNDTQSVVRARVFIDNIDSKTKKLKNNSDPRFEKLKKTAV